MSIPALTTDEIRAGIRALALSGQPVCLHASLRSFGRISGGADAVIDAFLAEGCTLLVPAFTHVFIVPPPPGMQPARNGWGERDHAVDCGRTYHPDVDDIDDELGALPRALLARPGRARGRHQVNSFAALGPLADELVAGQRPHDVYAPLRELAARGGSVLLAGVGLTRMTLIHLAEHQAGRALFLRWARDPSGSVEYVEIGSCSEGFDALEPALAPLAREAPVGESRWRAFPASETLAAAAAVIRRHPRITMCDDPACIRCRDSVAGGPLLA